MAEIEQLQQEGSKGAQGSKTVCETRKSPSLRTPGGTHQSWRLGFLFRLLFFWFFLFRFLGVRFLADGYGRIRFFLSGFLFLFDERFLFLFAFGALRDVALAVEVHAAIDQGLLHDRVSAERIVIVDHQVGVLADVNRSYALVNAQ